MASLFLARAAAIDSELARSTQLRGSSSNYHHNEPRDLSSALVPSRDARPNSAVDFCPDESPQVGSRCRTTGQRCHYDYRYSGCTWEDLSCSPGQTCSCLKSSRNGSDISTWQCMILDPMPCSVIATPANPTPEGLPEGDCEAGTALPTRPVAIDEGEVGDLCPAAMPRPGSSCQAIGEQCDFGYVYKGCTWDTLSCSPSRTCFCRENGIWACRVMESQPCSLAATPANPVPAGLPEGDCDSNAALPTEIESGEEASIDTCPASMPQPGSRCKTTGERCDFGHKYNGCTWESLSCVATRVCTCDQDRNDPTVSLWACRVLDVQPCSFLASFTDLRVPENLPEGDCDASLALPGPDGDIDETDVQPNEDGIICPRSPVNSGGCDASQVGATCNYDYVYSGCTWDELQCSWTTSCECVPDRSTNSRGGNWFCLARAAAPCFGGFSNGREIDPALFSSAFDSELDDGSNATDVEESLPSDQLFAESLPEGLPYGQKCDPSAELPTEPAFEFRPVVENGNFTFRPEPENATEPVFVFRPEVDEADATDSSESLVGRLSDECPVEPPPPGSSCIESHQSKLSCPYNHIYTGCFWDAIQCNPIQWCTCDNFGDGTWACASMAMMACTTKIPGLPTFQSCNPDDPLPLPRSASVVRDIAKGGGSLP